MIVLPTLAPIACSVVPPSAISEDEAGHRPLTTVGCADPRTACFYARRALELAPRLGVQV